MSRLAACVELDTHPHTLTSAMSTVLLTWPVCYVVHLLLEANFGLQLVRDNAALLTLAVPHIVLAIAMLWDTSWKMRVFVVVEGLLNNVLHRQHA